MTVDGSRADATVRPFVVRGRRTAALRRAAAGARATLGGSRAASTFRPCSAAARPASSAAWARSAAVPCAPATCCRSAPPRQSRRGRLSGSPLPLPCRRRARSRHCAVRTMRCSPTEALEALCTSRVHRHAAVESHGISARGPLPAACAARRHPLGRDAARLAPGARVGQPILLMADRQTTGGYPKIATVISADLPLAGQLAPGDWIEFAGARGTRRWPRSGAAERALGGACACVSLRARAAWMRSARPRAPRRAACAVHDVQGRRRRPTGWSTSHGGDEAAARRLRLHAMRASAGDASSAAVRTCWFPTPACAALSSASRRRCARDRRSTRSRRRRRDHQRPGPLDDQSRRRRARSMGRHAGHRRRRDLRQRALSRAV